MAANSSAVNASEIAIWDTEPFKRAFGEIVDMLPGVDANKLNRNGTLPELDNPYTDTRLDVVKESAKNFWGGAAAGGHGGVGAGASWRNWDRNRFNRNNKAADDDDDKKKKSQNDTEALLRKAQTAAGRAAALSTVARLKARFAGGLPLDSVRVPFSALEACRRVTDKLLLHFASKPRYPHEEIVESSEVAFLMVATNDSKLEEKLDGIRVQRQKFICLNDNLQHQDNHSRSAVALLHEFYESLFPLPSQFELPPGRENAVLYVNELRTVQRGGRTRFAQITVVALVAVGLLCCVVLGRRRSERAARRAASDAAHRRFLAV